MYDFRTLFDNNLAERDMRMAKVKQNVPSTFQTRADTATLCAIRNYLSTVHKHGLNVMDTIHDVLSDRPFTPCTVAGASK